MKKFLILFLLLIFLPACSVGNNNKNVPAPENLNSANDDQVNQPQLETYNLLIGRTDPDIQSQKEYNFVLPADVEFELQGVDAQSSYFVFKKDAQEIFKMINHDYTIGEDAFEQMYPEWNNYSFVGGHTNVLMLEDPAYEDDFFIFQESLTIDGQKVFE